jgi:hypothetical protein
MPERRLPASWSVDHSPTILFSHLSAMLVRDSRTRPRRAARSFDLHAGETKTHSNYVMKSDGAAARSQLAVFPQHGAAFIIDAPALGGERCAATRSTDVTLISSRAGSEANFPNRVQAIYRPSA